MFLPIHRFRSRAIFGKLGMKDFSRTHIAVIGAEDNFGLEFRCAGPGPRDVALWMAVEHSDKKALEIWDQYYINFFVVTATEAPKDLPKLIYLQNMVH